MKRIDWRIIVGVLLILAGISGILEKLDILPEGLNLFWGLALVGAGVTFLYIFFTNLKTHWWAAIPGFTLLGWGVAGFLPDSLGLDSLVSMGGIGIAFLVVYLADRQNWWALIPAGVVTTLGITSTISENYELEAAGGFFFLGLGLTFLLVAVLAKMSWSYIPAFVLLVLGIIVGARAESILSYIWIGAIFLAGIVFIVYAIRRKD